MIARAALLFGMCSVPAVRLGVHPIHFLGRRCRIGTLSDPRVRAAGNSAQPDKNLLGFNSIHLCMRFLRSHGHLAQAARIEAALEAAAGSLSEDKDDDVDPTIN